MQTRFRGAVPLSALAIAAFQLGGTFGASHNQPERRGIDAIAVLLVLTGPAALAGRDRWPLATAVVAAAAADVYIGLGYAYGPIFVSVALSIFVAVQSGRRKASALIAVLAYVGYVVASWLDPREPGRPSWVHLALVAGWVVVVWSVSDLVRTRRDQAAERRRLESDEQQRRADERRLRVAQELHDVLAHNISLINVQASVALHLVNEDPQQAATALATIKQASREALQELRSALELLRQPSDDADAPRAPAPRIDDVVTMIEAVRKSGVEVDLHMDPRPAALSAAVELATYRIVQEALTNVTRHSGARHADVRIAFVDGVSIDVVDDGRGGDAIDGNGITGMRERVATLGGTLEAGPLPGRGFRVAARLPVGAA